MNKSTERYLALLRGINVGGNNIIAKDDLRACFESTGATNVVTYIQSGNILFDSGKMKPDTLTKKIERALSKRFDYDAQAVSIRTLSILRHSNQHRTPGGTTTTASTTQFL